MTNTIFSEEVIEPDLPIVDSHHHLWFLPDGALSTMETARSIVSRELAPVFRQHSRYLFEDFMSDLNSGHNVRASVFVEAQTMYRASGPETLKSVGEVEFATGVAAMAASGLFGHARVCAGIVGGVDLSLGDSVEEVLLAHIQAGGGRYRGVRSPIIHDEDATILGFGVPHVLRSAGFRRGFQWLQRLGLSFDAFVLEPQLPDLIDLARAFPDTSLILNHVGGPVGVGRYSGQREAQFPLWRKNMHALSACPNVTVKLGGLGISLAGLPSFRANPRFTSQQLADEWRPYIETCIETFGADRCMLESNFPVDAAVASYSVLWNAFKRIVAGASDAEKRALFSNTATRVYRLDM
jgi:predicted TIM-barrel fold metal-dependent hydrolase